MSGIRGDTGRLAADVERRRAVPCVHFPDVVASRESPRGGESDCPLGWLYRCDLHGVCARTRRGHRHRDGVEVACCDWCPDYQPEG